MNTETMPDVATSSVILEPWMVILLNDDVHTFQEVIMQVMKATGCPSKRAEDITYKVHTEGEAVCYSGPKERCEHVASILEEIDLKTRLIQ